MIVAALRPRRGARENGADDHDVFTPIELLLAASGLLAGAFGALLGLGGGVLIVPILTLGFGVPLPTAVGTSLIGVIATSTGAAAINVRAGRADVRLGLTLAAGTVVGAPANPIAENTVVTLTANPGVGSTFVGWSGDCTGTGACGTHNPS